MASIQFNPLIPITRIEFAMKSTAVSGGRSASGAEQVVVSPSGYWSARLDLNLYDKAKILYYRAMLAQLQMRVGTLLVGPHDTIRPLDGSNRVMSQIDGVPIGDVAHFDHTPLGQYEPVHATLAADVAQGATEALISLVDTSGPQPGHYFGLGERLYIVRYSWIVSTGVMKLLFWPRLREGGSIGARVILDRPVCTMKLATDDTGPLSIGLGIRATTQLDLVEAV